MILCSKPQLRALWRTDMIDNLLNSVSQLSHFSQTEDKTHIVVQNMTSQQWSKGKATVKPRPYYCIC